MVPKRLYPLLSLIAVLLNACGPEDSVRVSPCDQEPQAHDGLAVPSIADSDQDFDLENDRIVEGRRIRGTASSIQAARTLKITTAETEPEFRAVLVQFSVTPVQSFPKSVILTGKVFDNNVGAPQEGIPMFFGSASAHPRLAALTDAYGEFHFRVWLRDERAAPAAPIPTQFYSTVDFLTSGMRRQQLAITSLDDGVLYLGGRFDERLEITSCFTYTYALEDLLPASEQSRGAEERDLGNAQEPQN